MISEILNHIHPIIVHFPIALILVGLLYDLVLVIRHRSLNPTKGLWIWLIAAVGAALAVASGPEGAARGNTTLLRPHSMFADWTMWVTFVVVAIRLLTWWRRKEKLTGLVLTGYLIAALASGALVLTTGYYGGQMVYDQGVGVQMNGKAVNPPQQGFHHKGQ